MVPTDQLSEVESVLAHPRPSADAPGKEQR
jgi:hypothetical protein